MQPACSLRVDRFKQAPASWTRGHVLHQRHRSCAPDHKDQFAHSPAYLKLLPRRVECSDAAFPNIPFPGDNQSAGAYAALRSADELSSGDSIDMPADAPTKPSSNGAPPPGDQPQPRIPHRWRIVGMMALAFVLCNMDKVYSTMALSLKHGPLIETVLTSFWGRANAIVWFCR